MTFAMQKSVAAKIREARHAKNMSQEDLGSKIGRCYATISTIETCKSNLTLLNAYKLTKALGITLNDLFNDFDSGVDK
jgi:ribosome-binding protein aMBF1 (putative translation factor)